MLRTSFIVAQACGTQNSVATKRALSESREWTAINSASGCRFSAGMCAVVPHQPAPITAHLTVFMAIQKECVSREITESQPSRNGVDCSGFLTPHFATNPFVAIVAVASGTGATAT